MKFWSIVFCILVLYSCNKASADLPFLGPTTKGKSGEFIHHKIQEFSFLNQDSVRFTNANVKGKIYVADFFFISCPTICPTMKTQMLRLAKEFKDQNDFMLLSHTIDPDRDSLLALKAYKKKLVGDSALWHFLWAPKEYTYPLAEKSYFTSAQEDASDTQMGGFIHSGAFVLVDGEGHIRGTYDGTKAKEVDKLILDIKLLLD
ncbi:MAG: SCO family protein [Leadbetterella sp.]